MPDPALPIRLIALDIDGTIIGDDQILGPRTMAAVKEASRRGIAVSIVTGRMAASAQAFAEALELHNPIVAHQGAVVRSVAPRGRPYGRLLYHRFLAPEVTVDIVGWCLSRGMIPHFQYLEKLIVGADEERLDEYRLFVGDRLRIVPDILARARGPVTKVVAIREGETHSLGDLDDARTHFAGRAEVTLSHPRFLEFLAPGVSKGRGIRWLARHLGIPLANTMAIGDQYNDLEMISEVGHGIAMPSAPEPVLAAARYVAPPLAEEGSAQMIEQLALDGWRDDGSEQGAAIASTGSLRGAHRS